MHKGIECLVLIYFGVNHRQKRVSEILTRDGLLRIILQQLFEMCVIFNALCWS